MIDATGRDDCAREMLVVGCMSLVPVVGSLIDEYMNWLKYLWCTVSLMVITSIAGCDPASSTSTSSSAPDPLTSILGYPDWHSIKPFLAKYGMTSLAGYVDVSRLERSVILKPFYTSLDSVGTDAFGEFKKASDSTKVGTVLDLRVNGTPLGLDPSGVYTYVYYADEPALKAYFGDTSNALSAQRSADVPAFSTSVRFDAPIQFSGIRRSDTVHRSAELTLRWNATAHGFCRIALNESDSSFSRSDAGLVIYVENTGSYTIPSSALMKFASGYKNISITRFEPSTLPLQGGKNLAIIGRSIHELSVILK